MAIIDRTRRTSFLTRALALIVLCVGVSAIVRAIKVLDGEPIIRIYHARALSDLHGKIGSVPTAVLCAGIGIALLLFALKIWKNSATRY